MVSATEAATGGRTQFAASLASGIGTIAQNQEITFRRYIRMILPLDGSAFWVRDDAVAKQSGLFNAAQFNTAQFNQVYKPGATLKIKVKGSLHYGTQNNQDESEGFAVNNVLFTAEEDVEELNNIAPRTLMIGEFEGLQFAFSERASFYKQAELYHYRGFAVYPSMKIQIIEPGDVVDTRNVVVSNSLPAWLTLNKYAPMWPSYLVDDNIVPPWCSIHIFPDDTSSLQLAPYIDQTGTHWNLSQDRVRLTFYGLRNFQAQDFIDYVDNYMLGTNDMGSMSAPIVRDEKRTQAELNILAQKKTIEYRVSYYQSRMRDIAQRYIKTATIHEILT